MSAAEERDEYMRRQEADHDLIRQRTTTPAECFRAIRLRRETEANARLIATAPELYQEVEFLCARLRELETMILDDEVGNEYYGHVAPSRARLEMLLQKARGESDQ